METCERHLIVTQSAGTEIEAILTSYVSAVIYATFEANAKEAVAHRGGGTASDASLAAFATVASSRLIRSIKVSDLAGFAAIFSVDCRDRFRANITDEEINAWDSIIQNRHGIAHESSDGRQATVSNLTFAELKDLYAKALRVLDSFERCLK